MIESLPGLELAREQHLRVLRRLDRGNRWESVGDFRRCLDCGEVFKGSEIAIVGGTRAYGPLRLQCPGKRCIAGPESWVPVIVARSIDEEPARAPVMTHDGHALTVRRKKSLARTSQSTLAETGPLGRWGAAVQNWLAHIMPGEVPDHRSYREV